MASASPRLPAPAAAGSALPTRQRLIDAAYELLEDQGYHATTVQHIATRAGLTTGAIYANFANKHELLVLAVLSRWVGVGRGVWFSPNIASPANHNLLELLVKHLSAPPAPEHRLLTEVMGAALRDQGAQTLLRETAETVASLTRDAIDEAKARGELDEQVPTEAWVALSVNQFLGAITAKAFDLPQPDGDEVAALLGAFLRTWHPDA